MTDYYEVLGVPRDASPEQIKKAYRRLARENHPDVAGGEPGAEDRFKDVSRAYDVLGNPDKRRQYDLGGDPASPGGGAGGGFGFQDIFETFFGAAAGAQQQRGPMPRARRGQDALVRIDLDLADVTFGTHRDVPVDTAVACPTCGGTCCRPGTTPRTCEICHGRGVVQRVARSFLGQVMTTQPCAACHGFGTTIPEPCPECSGEGRVRSRRTLSVDVPAGVENGNRIKLTGQGEVGPAGGPAGDVYLEVRERRHETFVREGDDLHVTLEVPMTAAALGTVLTLDTLDGPQEVDLRPGTQPEQVVTVKGLGVGRLHVGGRGDLHVHVDVQVPLDLDDEQATLLRRLAELRGEERPEARLAAHHHGVFGKLRDKLSGR
ncbi:molecular chaperone DnaJ [Cellulomonas composti]|uniref:Chaperone protein DnaJ n=1 Tax=Cellulomonas composti TaxID=266130 RepID=A0A511JDW4_9CELL|nr:molecular chaperone DnaJ [Cellulomonas composti]GEL96187.1 chaperone protein DnaJ 2 [Cellulomonas composti]